MPKIEIFITDEQAALIDKWIENGKTNSRRSFAKEAVEVACDKVYLDENYTLLNTHIINAIEAVQLQSEERLGNRLARVYADVAIELGIMNQLVAQSVDVGTDELNIYRKIAVDHIQSTGKILSYKDLKM